MWFGKQVVWKSHCRQFPHKTTPHSHRRRYYIYIKYKVLCAYIGANTLFHITIIPSNIVLYYCIWMPLFEGMCDRRDGVKKKGIYPLRRHWQKKAKWDMMVSVWIKYFINIHYFSFSKGGLIGEKTCEIQFHFSPNPLKDSVNFP